MTKKEISADHIRDHLKYCIFDASTRSRIQVGKNQIFFCFSFFSKLSKYFFKSQVLNCTTDSDYLQNFIFSLTTTFYFFFSSFLSFLFISGSIADAIAYCVPGNHPPSSSNQQNVPLTSLYCTFNQQSSLYQYPNIISFLNMNHELFTKVNFKCTYKSAVPQKCSL